MHEARVFLVELGLKIHRGMKAEGAVEPRPVVKDFNPVKDGDLGHALIIADHRWIHFVPWTSGGGLCMLFAKTRNLF